MKKNLVRKLAKFFTNRFVIMSVLILFQAAVLLFTVFRLSQSYAPIAAGFWLLSIFVVLGIINNQSNPAVKIPWVWIITLMPIFGALLYLILGSSKLSKKNSAKLSLITTSIRNTYQNEATCIQELSAQNPHAASQSAYITNVTSIPLYKNTTVEYFPLGEDFFTALAAELEKAERYIFMEYFIIAEGLMWNTIRSILQRKKAQGVDVRVIYDDVGSVATLPYRYDRILTKQGVPCCVFNPYRPALRTILQNRDHRKICVIDGTTAFTGGINIADEYINRIARFGHWKDTAVMLRGDAAFSFALIFLELWDLAFGAETNYDAYRPTKEASAAQEASPAREVSNKNNASNAREASPEQDASRVPDASTARGACPKSAVHTGFVQPYSDSPLDSELVGEQVYLNIINQSTRYVYITTPYFIVDNELVTALQLAAKRNVDVRIIMPYIPDKWLVHAVSQSYYRDLVEAGVRVYEYLPGFMHAKSCVCDDSVATNGTINLDFRSLYHHFECGVWMYKTPAVLAMKTDFLKTQEQCREITHDYLAKTHLFKRVIRSIFKIFAPLM